MSRAKHMMVVDGATGKVLGDVPDTPGGTLTTIDPRSGDIDNESKHTIQVIDVKS